MHDLKQLQGTFGDKSSSVSNFAHEFDFELLVCNRTEHFYELLICAQVKKYIYFSQMY